MWFGQSSPSLSSFFISFVVWINGRDLLLMIFFTFTETDCTCLKTIASCITQKTFNSTFYRYFQMVPFAFHDPSHQRVDFCLLEFFFPLLHRIIFSKNMCHYLICYRAANCCSRLQVRRLYSHASLKLVLYLNKVLKVQTNEKTSSSA